MGGINETIGYTLWQLQHRVQRNLEAALAETSLSLAQISTLARLRDEPGISAAALARHLLITPQAVSLLIAKLETAAYLTRTPPASGRSHALTITAAGRAALDHAEQVAAAVHEQVFADLAEPERGQLKHLLERALRTATLLDATQRTS